MLSAMSSDTHASCKCEISELSHTSYPYDCFSKIYGNVLFIIFVNIEKGPIRVAGKATRYGLGGSEFERR